MTSREGQGHIEGSLLGVFAIFVNVPYPADRFISPACGGGGGYVCEWNTYVCQVMTIIK